METLYIALSQKLEHDILEHKLTGRLPGMLRLSKELGVHHVTLGKALKLLEQKGLVTIRGTAGTYVVTQTPRMRHHVIAVVGMNQGSGDNRQLLAQLNDLARPKGYTIITIDFETDLFRQNKNILLNFPVDGFIFQIACLLEEQLDIIKRESIPVVCCGRKDPYPWIDQVISDHDTGYDILLQYLIKLGHRRIAYVDFDREPENKYYLDLIRKAFRRNLGNDYRPELFYTRNTATDQWIRYGEHYWERYTQQAIDCLLALPLPPTAIVTVDNKLLRNAYRVLTRRHLVIPQDISLAGVWTAPNSDWENVQFTGIHFDSQNMLRQAVTRLLDRLQNGPLAPQTFLQAPEFHPGSTVAPPRSAQTTHPRN